MRGLRETLRSWSGQGQLWNALATSSHELIAERVWTEAMVRRRAHRVLFERLIGMLALWPEETSSWLDALPASSETWNERSPVPGPGVSWTRTRLEGWPPRSFVGRRRRRVPETVLSTAMRWTLERLEVVVRDGAKPADSAQFGALARAKVALSLMGIEPLASVSAAEPSPADLAAVAAEGYPWRSLVPVARELLAVGRVDALAQLALEVVAPHDDLSGRLFHLAVLGEVLFGLRTCGATVTSRHPLGDSSRGPAYKVVDAADRQWDLWFEAAGAWGYYGADEPYQEVAAGVPGAGGALGTDLMLIRPDECALLLECKHSSNPGVVARDGYLQALAYASEATLLATDVTSVVVGPEGVVATDGWTHTIAGQIAIIEPASIPPLIEFALTP